MKKKKKNVTSVALLGTIVAANAPIVAFAEAPEETVVTQHNEVQSTKYPLNVMGDLRVALGGSHKSTELDSQINALSKMEVLATYLTDKPNLNGNQVRKAVKDVFGIDLNKMSKNNEGNLSYYTEVLEVVRAELGVDSQSTEKDDKINSKSKAQVMDIYLHSLDGDVSINDVQIVVNGVFGVNLAGISTLENARFSVKSKGGWISQKPADIFVVESTKGDIDVYIYPSDYFKENTGINGVPIEFREQLEQIGMTYNTELERMEYSTTNGESVPGDFKNEMMAIVFSYTNNNFLEL